MTREGGRLRKPRSRRREGSSPGSLAALLDERLHEVLGVGLQYLVDLVENGVDVVVEGFLALGDIGLGSHLLLGGGLLTALLWLLLLLGHVSTLSPCPGRSVADSPYANTATRFGGRAGRAPGRARVET